MKATASSVIAIIAAIAAPSLAAPSLVQNSTLSVSNVTGSDSGAFQPDSLGAPASSFSASASQPSSTPTSSFRTSATPSVAYDNNASAPAGAYRPLPAGANLTQHPNAEKYSKLRHEEHELFDIVEALEKLNLNFTLPLNGSLIGPTSLTNGSEIQKRQWSSDSPEANAEITYYYQNGQYGSCGQQNSDQALIVAAPEWLYSYVPADQLCGSTFIAWRPYSGEPVLTATIADTCPSCDGYHFDLSVGAFEVLGDLNAGEYDDVTFYIVTN